MAEQHDYVRMNYDRSASTMKVHGILAIIFGGLGILISLFLMALFAFSVTEYNDYQIAGSFVSGFLVFVFGVIPHAYLLISGITLLKQPAPSVAKTLTIINLIVGVVYNLVVMVLAIISLVQMDDYRHGHSKTKE